MEGFNVNKQLPPVPNFDANKALPQAPTSYKWMVIPLVIVIGGVLFAIFYPKKDD